jgi:hypothetical protein
MTLYYRIYVGRQYEGDLCALCLEKLAPNHAVILVEHSPWTESEEHMLVYHTTCFEDRYHVAPVLLGFPRILPRTP